MTQQWTDAHEQEARAQGWTLFVLGNDEANHLEIQRVDELDYFDTDEEAIKFVEEHAKIESSYMLTPFGHDTCALAMEHIRLQSENQGQDRENYTDNQDRESYTVSE